MKRFLWRDRHRRPRVRLGGKTYPLRDAAGNWHEPDTEQGDRLYWAIMRGANVEPRTSWNALIASYRQSDRWRRLSPRTRADYERVLTYIAERSGGRDAMALKRKHVIEAMRANEHRTRFANYIPAVMSVLMEHAIDLGWRSDNPARGVRKLPTPDERRAAHEPWTDEAVALWRREARPVPLLILELGIGTVQRPADLCRFRWNDVENGELRVTQGKTGRRLWLPLTERLAAALTAAPRRGLTILTRPDGRPMDYRHLSRVMLDERKRLGTTRHDLHALRYRGVMELAWAGCTDEQIASYSGHRSRAMVAQYAGEARQRTHAQAARSKRR